ncbi:MAG TPA: DUF721 domain-containing protein [Cyclobacteriaceae bacterium]|nr:DUF721 domain-containing protein [Cyclobacteriaceae bacterium]
MSNKREQKKEFLPVGEAIREMLKQYHIEDKFNQQTLIDGWHQIVGKSVAEKTRKLSIKNQVLFAEISSASLKHELALSKEQLLKRIQTDFPAANIREIVIL